MSDIAAGSLVKHVSLGIGKVVAIEATAVHVFFPQSEGHYAAKLRWPAARSLVTQDGIEPDPWLAGLTSFALDRESGRYALATNFVSHADAIAEFLKRFPQGFADEAYVGEGTGKRRARRDGALRPPIGLMHSVVVRANAFSQMASFARSSPGRSASRGASPPSQA